MERRVVELSGCRSPGPLGSGAPWHGLRLGGLSGVRVAVVRGRAGGAGSAGPAHPLDWRCEGFCVAFSLDSMPAPLSGLLWEFSFGSFKNLRGVPLGQRREFGWRRASASVRCAVSGIARLVLRGCLPENEGEASCCFLRKFKKTCLAN